MNNVVIPKEKLEELYIGQGMSMKCIANTLNVSTGKVHKFIHLYGITPRSNKEVFALLKDRGWKMPESAIMARKEKTKDYHPSDETKKKMSEAKRKGGIGHKKKRRDGYVVVYFPDHPRSNKSGYIMEHDLIMESVIGRPMKDDECVHHVDEDRSNNKIENLRLMTKSEHMSYHSKKRWNERRNGLSIQ